MLQQCKLFNFSHKSHHLTTWLFILVLKVLYSCDFISTFLLCKIVVQQCLYILPLYSPAFFIHNGAILVSTGSYKPEGTKCIQASKQINPRRTFDIVVQQWVYLGPSAPSSLTRQIYLCLHFFLWILITHHDPWTFDFPTLSLPSEKTSGLLLPPIWFTHLFAKWLFQPIPWSRWHQ